MKNYTSYSYQQSACHVSAFFKANAKARVSFTETNLSGYRYKCGTAYQAATLQQQSDLAERIFDGISPDRGNKLCRTLY